MKPWPRAIPKYPIGRSTTTRSSQLRTIGDYKTPILLSVGKLNLVKCNLGDDLPGEHMRWAHVKHSCAGGIAFQIMLLVSITPAMAVNFRGMDLESLMQIQLKAVNPTGIGHTHEEGEFMLGYQNHLMKMEGNLDGTNPLEVSEVFAKGFMVSPTEMDMEMHMFELMYGVTDKLTLMAMNSYNHLSMDHVTRMGGMFTTTSEGFGDLKLTGLYSLSKKHNAQTHTTFGLSVPIGSINHKDVTPMGLVRLPYPMQIGSGTWDLIAGLTYLGSKDRLFWGAEAQSVIRLGENSNDYRLGNRVSGSVWLSRNWNDWLISTLQIQAQDWGNIHGADPLLNPMLVPTADPHRRGGTLIAVRFQQSLYIPKGKLTENRLSGFFEIPVYQDLDGPQLETDWSLGFQWKWTF